MLKVGSPQPQNKPMMPPPVDDMGPMGGDIGGEGQEMAPPPPAGPQPGPMGGPKGPMPDDAQQDGFGADFDAGVDANEQEDPKKYIQQLTGKLSQSLRTYNESLPHPDEDLCKFVAGMVVKQAVKGLTPDDAEEVLKKIKADDDMSEYEDNGEQPQQGNMGGQPPMDRQGMPPQGNMPPQPIPNNMGESFERTSRRQQIDELFNDVMNSDREESQIPDVNVDGKGGYRRKPFTSPMFR